MAAFDDIFPELDKLGIAFTEAEIFDGSEIAANPLGDRIGTLPDPEMAAYVTEDGIEIIPIQKRAVVTFAGKTPKEAAEEIRTAVEVLRGGQP